MKRILNFLTVLALLCAAWSPVFAASKTNPTVVTEMLDRIGGAGTSDRIVTIVDDALSTNGKDIFVITSQDGKPCIKGNCILAVTTGINWYLNHHAHVNLTWNQLTADLSAVDFPVPLGEETHTCSADLRYYLNYCTYSYSCALWTTERWLQEIDWMALHGINMPLMLVGLDAVWYDLYTQEYGYTAAEVSEHVAGPAFQAWWGMINVEGHGGPNPKWWYERSRALCQTMLERMRSFGMTPVLPAFSGAVPNDFGTKASATEVNNAGTWQGITAPGLIGHKSNKWEEVSKKYYEHLEAVMGTSKYYAMDVNHEGGTYLHEQNTPLSYADQPGFIQALYNALSTNVSSDAVWVAQAWGHNPSSTLLNNVAQGKLMVLDLNAENDPRGKNGSFGNHNFIYCMLHNFGGRIGLHGRFDKTMDNYYASLSAKPNQCKGIGATPEGIETNPMLYDMLFELPWMEKPANKLDWVKEYTTSRYGQVNVQAQNAYDKLYQSVYNCTTGQQGTSEPIVCAQPSLTASKVSAWSTAVISHNTDFVIEAADDLLSQVETLSGNNYNYDLLDVTRQALTDYAMTLLQQLNTDWNNGGKNNADFAPRAQHYLNLIEGIDKLLNTHQSYRYGNWGEMARAIASEPAAVAGGATSADADWLEHDNLRLQITSWDTKNNWSLFDYSNREWGGMLKDYYLARWKLFFDNKLNGTALPSSWYEWGKGWQKDTNHTYTYTAAPEGNTKTIAKEQFDTYFWPLTDTKGNKNYVRRHVEQTLKNDVYATQGYRGENYIVPLPNGATLSSLSIDLNNDGAYGDGETFTEATVAIPAGAAAGLVKARLVLDDQTVLNYQLALADNITEARTVSVSVAEGCEDMGTVSIDDHEGTSVTTTDYLTLRATANSGYDFLKWGVDINGTASESTDNPYHYYGKDAASLTAHFVQSIWGVPAEDWGDGKDIRNNQYVTAISYTQDGNTTEIYTASAVPTTLFNTAPTLVQVAKGSCFKVNLSDAGNLGYCNLSAYIDLNGDGDFDDEGELVTARGNKSAFTNGICNDPVTVLLPYDMPTGITHLRLRFDGAYKSGYDSETGAFPAKNTLNRMCYEVLVNVLDKANHATHIVIQSEDEKKGTVRNITGVTGLDIDVPVGTQICMEAFPVGDYVFKYWEDQYGRVASTDASFYYYPAESGTFTARFGYPSVQIDKWTATVSEDGATGYVITALEGEGPLNIPESFDGCTFNAIKKGALQNLPTLTALHLPSTLTSIGKAQETLSLTGAKTNNAALTPEETLASDGKWNVHLDVENDGSTFNEYGSGLFATGTDALANGYIGGFQFYLEAGGKLVIKVNSEGGDKYTSTLTMGATFSADLDYDGAAKTVNVTLTNAEGNTESKNYSGVTLNDISTFSSSIPAGVNFTAILTDLNASPLKGSTALKSLTVADGNTAFKAVDNVLYTADGTTLLAYPEGLTTHRFNLPADVTSIAGGAFTAAPQLDRIVATATTPASAKPNAFAKGFQTYVQADGKEAAYRTAWAQPMLWSVAAGNSLDATDVPATDMIELCATDDATATATNLNGQPLSYTRTLSNDRLYPLYFAAAPTAIFIDGLTTEEAAGSLINYTYADNAWTRAATLAAGANMLSLPSIYTGKSVTFRTTGVGTSATTGFGGNATAAAENATPIYVYDATTNAFNYSAETPTASLSPFDAALYYADGDEASVEGPDRANDCLPVTCTLLYNYGDGTVTVSKEIAQFSELTTTSEAVAADHYSIQSFGDEAAATATITTAGQEVKVNCSLNFPMEFTKIKGSSFEDGGTWYLFSVRGKLATVCPEWNETKLVSDAAAILEADRLFCFVKDDASLQGVSIYSYKNGATAPLKAKGTGDGTSLPYDNSQTGASVFNVNDYTDAAGGFYLTVTPSDKTFILGDWYSANYLKYTSSTSATDEHRFQLVKTGQEIADELKIAVNTGDDLLLVGAVLETVSPALRTAAQTYAADPTQGNFTALVNAYASADVKAATIKQPEETKFYQLISPYDANLAGCIVSSIAINNTEGNNTNDDLGDRNLQIADPGVRSVAETAWVMEKNAENEYYFRHANSDYYIANLSHYNNMAGMEVTVAKGWTEPFVLANINNDNLLWSIRSKNNSSKYLHAGTGRGTGIGQLICRTDNPATNRGLQWHIREITEVPVTVGAAKWATLCLPMAVTIPEDASLHVYYVSEIADNGAMTLQEVGAGESLAAKQPVLLYSTSSNASDTYTFAVTTSGNTLTNKLSGTTARRKGFNASDATAAAYITIPYYGLGIFNEVVGFYPATSNIIAANKAYLLKSALPAEAQSAASLFFNWTTTGLTEATTGKKAERYYDLNGRLVPYPTTGVYINGEGKKVFIKN